MKVCLEDLRTLQKSLEERIRALAYIDTFDNTDQELHLKSLKFLREYIRLVGPYFKEKP